MAITIGDKVPAACTKVTYLPLRALLKNGNDLLQYDGSFTPEPLRHATPYSVVENAGSPGMDELFAANDLEICNTLPHPQAWGTKHYPIGCWVQCEEDDITPPRSDNDLTHIGVIAFRAQAVFMTESVFANRGGHTLNNQFTQIPGPPFAFGIPSVYHWNTDMGDVEWDLIDPPGITNFPVNQDTNIPFYGNQPLCPPDVAGKISIKNTWDPDVRTTAGTVKIEGQGRGILFTLDPAPPNSVFGWPPSNPIICRGAGTSAPVTQAGSFVVSYVTTVTLKRWEWNFVARCNPGGLRPVPGETFPPLVVDPNDPNLPCP